MRCQFADANFDHSMNTERKVLFLTILMLLYKRSSGMGINVRLLALSYSC